MARASVHIMNIDKETYDKHTSSICSHINTGSGKDISIKELAETIKEVVNFNGEIDFDPSKPDGSTRKLLNSERINKFGFKPKTHLKEGLIKTYKDYLKFYANI